MDTIIDYHSVSLLMIIIVMKNKIILFDVKSQWSKNLLLKMKWLNVLTEITGEIEPYFLRKTFFVMLINHALKEKRSKINSN